MKGVHDSYFSTSLPVRASPFQRVSVRSKFSDDYSETSSLILPLSYLDNDWLKESQTVSLVYIIVRRFLIISFRFGFLKFLFVIWLQGYFKRPKCCKPDSAKRILFIVVAWVYPTPQIWVKSYISTLAVRGMLEKVSTNIFLIHFVLNYSCDP